MREGLCRIPINDNHPLRVAQRAKKLEEEFVWADVVSERHAAARAAIDLNLDAIADLATADAKDLDALQTNKRIVARSRDFSPSDTRRDHHGQISVGRGHAC